MAIRKIKRNTFEIDDEKSNRRCLVIQKIKNGGLHLTGKFLDDERLNGSVNIPVDVVHGIADGRLSPQSHEDALKSGVWIEIVDMTISFNFDTSGNGCNYIWIGLYGFRSILKELYGEQILPERATGFPFPP